MASVGTMCEAESKIMRIVSVRSHFSRRVTSAGSKVSQTVSAGATYDGKSRQEKNIGGLFITCDIVSL